MIFPDLFRHDVDMQIHQLDTKQVDGVPLRGMCDDLPVPNPGDRSSRGSRAMATISCRSVTASMLNTQTSIGFCLCRFFQAYVRSSIITVFDMLVSDFILACSVREKER